MPSNPRSRGGSGGPHSSPRNHPPSGPMSERQQLALVLQLTSQKTPPATPTPAEERKRNRQQRNERGETPLHVAAIKGDHEQVKKLLDQGQDPDIPDFAGWTALHEACSYGRLEVVEVLVEGGANVNAKGLDDDTPLHDAATSGNLQMVKYLVEHGADPFVKNIKGKMPADYAAAHVYNYIVELKDNNVKGNTVVRARDDSGKKSSNVSGSGMESGKRTSMDGLAEDDKDPPVQEKNTAESKVEGHNQLSSGVVSSSQDDVVNIKRGYFEEGSEVEGADDEGVKKRKRKEEEKEPMPKPAPVSRSATGRVLTGTKPPGPASKTGTAPLGKNNTGQNLAKGSSGNASGKSNSQVGQKGSAGGKANAQNSHQGKSSGGTKNSLNSQSKSDRKSPVASPKPNQNRENEDVEEKAMESSGPKVPPLKIVIPGGASSAANRNEQEGEGPYYVKGKTRRLSQVRPAKGKGGTGQRGGGKGRGNAATLPYVIPCTSNDTGHASDSSDGNSDDKRSGDGGKAAQRVLRSHRANDGEKERERASPQTGSDGRGSQQSALSANKSPPPAGSSQDHDHQVASGSGTNTRADTGQSSVVELHPRKRKLKSSKDTHSREQPRTAVDAILENTHNVSNCNPYQMYLHIRKQLDRRQKNLFPVKPKPPKDFNKYLMNRCTYTLQSNVSPEPQIELPPNLSPLMKEEFLSQEKERHRVRVQHLVEKEKLVLAVEQEILRVHGRAERAVANQALPYSVCTILRDEEVYNMLAPEQEEKRNAQRSRCNGRQINSWLQEVDDKWEKIKEGMLRRQHTEAETLHAVQKMSWEWKLKEVGLCDYKATPTIDPTHVPQLHVSNFDLPA